MSKTNNNESERSENVTIAVNLTIEVGSDNVFEDLGLPNAEARLARSKAAFAAGNYGPPNPIDEAGEALTEEELREMQEAFEESAEDIRQGRLIALEDLEMDVKKLREQRYARRNT